MAEYNVSIKTFDGQSMPNVTPTSVLGKPYDTIKFSSLHSGSQPPSEIYVVITSGMVGAPPSGSPFVQEFVLPPNSSHSVVISKDNKTAQITYSVSLVSPIGIDTPRPIVEDD